jgi:hypothetical protein
MGRDLDFLLVEEMAAFVPSDRQTTLKLLIQERVNPQVLGKLTLSEIEVLEPYISPFSLVEVLTWFRVPGFFEWLLTPDSFMMTIYKAKNKAAETVIDMLDLDPTEELDSKILSVKLKAAELLLKSDMKREQKVKNTMVINNRLPKHLANKSVEALEGELRKLKE